ncbi:porin family protein [Roseateles sp. DAIF2]|uniref:porin family protein n=1 Tax=Roseateles sp. DAIF2 TaxID=2714952 RepID=UPI0018A27D7C|nr:porin family protein [Roseateles sp. DAIF2]QPF71841.1 porin family protein [Roseateles sp. DAIF2]
MKKAFVLAALAIAAGQTLAAGSAWYVGGDIGSSKFKVEGEKSSRTGFGGTVGYSLNENVAFEVQARRLGRWTLDGEKLSANSLSASVLGILPLSKEFSLYGRLGYARNSLDWSEGNVSVSVHKNKALIGFGGAYAIDKNWSLRAEYVNLGKNTIGSGADRFDVKINQFNLGAVYAF